MECLFLKYMGNMCVKGSRIRNILLIDSPNTFLSDMRLVPLGYSLFACVQHTNSLFLVYLLNWLFIKSGKLRSLN